MEPVSSRQGTVSVPNTTSTAKQSAAARVTKSVTGTSLSVEPSLSPLAVWLLTAEGVSFPQHYCGSHVVAVIGLDMIGEELGDSEHNGLVVHSCNTSALRMMLARGGGLG